MMSSRSPVEKAIPRTAVPLAAVDWYTGFLKKVYDTPDFQKYLEDNALKPEFTIGAPYVKWVEENEKLHRDLMAKGGLLK